MRPARDPASQGIPGQQNTHSLGLQSMAVSSPAQACAHPYACYTRSSSSVRLRARFKLQVGLRQVCFVLLQCRRNVAQLTLLHSTIERMRDHTTQRKELAGEVKMFLCVGF